MPHPARLLDSCSHPSPGVLFPGKGSQTVLIGFLPAWRALPHEVGTALYSLSLTMESLLLEPTLNLISRKTTQVMGVDSCSIYLLQVQDEQLVLKASTGLAPEAVGRAALQLGQGLTGWAAEHDTPVAVRDAAADPRFWPLPETEEMELR